MLSCDNFLNFGLYLYNFLNNLWNFLYNFLNVRNNSFYFFDFLIYNNLFNNFFNLIYNYFLLFCDNNLLNYLRNLNNFLANFFLNDQFLYDSINWNWNFNWRDDWSLNLYNLNLFCIKGDNLLYFNIFRNFFHYFNNFFDDNLFNFYRVFKLRNFN